MVRPMFARAVAALLALAGACKADSFADPTWRLCRDQPTHPDCEALRAKICAENAQDVRCDAPDAGSVAEGGERDAELLDAEVEEEAGPVCDCRGSRPVCVADTGECVACTAAEDGACGGATRLCDVSTNTCVGCLSGADCSAASAPVCGADKACGPCTSDGECSAQGAALPMCNPASGGCVACLPNAAEASAEGCASGLACDPATLTCTGAARGSLGRCIACRSDSECIAGTRCVATSFRAGAHGSYCLLVGGAGPCPDQYAAKREATSSLGVTGNFCFPDDQFTTCEGILSFQNLCTTPADCGAPNVEDGLCIDQVCSYGCDADRDCSGTAANRCTSAVDPRSCRTN